MAFSRSPWANWYPPFTNAIQAATFTPAPAAHGGFAVVNRLELIAT
jgi:hypothetical protein